jgi:hypothetical protein
MYRISIIFFTLVIASSELVAQPIPDTLRADSTTVYDTIDHTIDDRISDAQRTEQTVERLTRIIENPLDVNRASLGDLSSIPILPPSVAQRIVNHRRNEGPFSQIKDLTTIRGVDTALLQALRPYLTITNQLEAEAGDASSLPSMSSILNNLNLDVIQRVTRDLDLGRGFKQDTSGTKFRGSPERVTTRVRLSYERRLRIAMTLDKDPGEPMRWAPETDTYGFDHVAGNLTLNDWGPLQTLVLGDFTIEYGQGAALWQGLTFGKGRSPVSPLLRNGRGIVPFQSASEDRFFRGAAATVSLSPSLSVSGFVSRRYRDATLDSSTTSGAPPYPAQTLSTGGRHRTPSEIQRKGTFGKSTVGGAVEYRSSTYHLGMTAYRSWFDRPLSPPPDRPDEQFAVSGTGTSMLSLFGSAFLDPYTLFGELARSPSGVYGGVVGAALDHEAGVQAILLGRRFPAAFRGLYNSAVGESGATQNEVGVYTGLRVRLADRWRIGAYVDQYRFPWLRFGLPRPGTGLDTRIVVEYDPRPWLSTYLQLRAERETVGAERPGPGGRPLGALQSERRYAGRWYTEYSFSEAFTTRTRIHLSRYSNADDGSSHGVFLSQGFRFQPLNSLRLDARLAFFDTEGFDSRIYAYEHDLLYSFSVPALFDQGRRTYVLAQYKPTSDITLEAKYGVTWYPHRQTIGSGLNRKDGNRAREIRAQIRWQY